jgi:hypothetical protein
MTDELFHDKPELVKKVENFKPADPDFPISASAPEPAAKAPTASEEEKEALVADVQTFISKYVILPQQRMALVLALWAISTHSFDTFDCFPYLTVTSPTKQCGKTRLAEVLELLCAEPLRAANLSEAVLFRLVDDKSPTLIIDEAESLRNKKSERAQAIVGLLNAGHRKGALSYRCDGPGHAVKKFRVFCPKVVIAIGNVPDTVRDRSVAIQMQRKQPNDAVERFIFKQVRGPAADLKERIVQIVSACEQDIEGVYADYKLDLLSDREAENWTPIFCLCSVLAGRRLTELREIALAFAKGKAAFDADDSLSMRLLSDLQTILGNGESDTLFGKKLAVISSVALVAKLRDIEEAPWAEYELTPRRLARLLKHFGVHPGQVRDGSQKIRGYTVMEFTPLFSRYLGVQAVQAVHGA